MLISLMIAIEHSDDWFDIAINYNTLAINKLIDAVYKKSDKNKKLSKLIP